MKLHYSLLSKYCFGRTANASSDKVQELRAGCSHQPKGKGLAMHFSLDIHSDVTYHFRAAAFPPGLHRDQVGGFTITNISDACFKVSVTGDFLKISSFTLPRNALQQAIPHIHLREHSCNMSRVTFFLLTRDV